MHLSNHADVRNENDIEDIRRKRSSGHVFWSTRLGKERGFNPSFLHYFGIRDWRDHRYIQHCSENGAIPDSGSKYGPASERSRIGVSPDRKSTRLNSSHRL